MIGDRIQVYARMKRALTRGFMKVLPDALAYRLMTSQAGKTTELPLLPAEEVAMSSAKPLRFGLRGQGTAFEWGSGPLIVLVHGWNGRAAQMAPLATTLAANGFRCVALDVTGNGAQGPRFTCWHYFLRDIEDVTRAIRSEVFAYVGHSSGGTTMMAARRAGRIQAQRYICICSPSYPFLSVDSVRNDFNPREPVMESYKLHLTEQFEITWSDLAAGGSYADAGKDLLLVYAGKDKLVPYHEGNRIHALCPGSVLVKASDYGHRSILTAPELSRETLAFLEDK